MKKYIWFIARLAIVLLVIFWMTMFVIDFFRAKGGTKPLICISEKTIEKNNNEYYKCISLGYKYYEYKSDDKVSYGFEAIFIENEVEKKLGEQND